MTIAPAPKILLVGYGAVGVVIAYELEKVHLQTQGLIPLSFTKLTPHICPRPIGGRSSDGRRPWKL